MNLKYRVGYDREINTFYNTCGICPERNEYGIMTVYVNQKGQTKEYNRTVRKDKHGKEFFTWNKKKIMFYDFLSNTPEEFIKRIEENDDCLFGDALSQVLLKYGLDSIHVMINVGKLNGRNYEDEWVEYHFVEDYLHKPVDNYKLCLEPVQLGNGYPIEDTYTTDLVAMFKKCTNVYNLKANVM